MTDTRLVARLALLAAVWLGALLFAEAARSEPTLPRVLILGASITYGGCTGCTEAERYPNRLRELDPGRDYRVAAWSGSGMLDLSPESVTMSDQQLFWPPFVFEERLNERVNLWELLVAPQVALYRPHYVAVITGFNDTLRPLRGRFNPERPAPLEVATPEEYRQAVVEVVEAIECAGAIPVIAIDAPAGPFWVGPPFDVEETNAILRDYRDAIESVCQERGLRCGPDIHAALLGRVEAYEETDQVHPNARGHELMAQAWAEWFAGEPTRPLRTGTGTPAARCGSPR
jgi:lysophospholipase L1-like esterase